MFLTLFCGIEVSRMSMTKRSLTIAEQDEQRKLVGRLVEGGADLDRSTLTRGSKRRIQISQDPEMFASYAGASPRGFHYVVYVHIVALVGRVLIEHFDLSSSEWEMGTYPIEDPALGRSCKLEYCLGDRSTFPRDQVLNHRLDKKILRSGDVIEGWLLFGSFTPIPKHYVYRSMMPATLSMWDQFDEMSEVNVELYVGRSANPTLSRPSRRNSLFERSDGVVTPPDWAEFPAVDPGRPETGSINHK
jgi:hypothetical protein